ncbi:unnamed protein product [Prorocentrum cordatum]|nr:unnamed protein product [Polarella glacialis]
MLGHVAKLTQSVRRNRSGRKQGTERGAARGQGGRQASAGARGVGASGGERSTYFTRTVDSGTKLPRRESRDINRYSTKQKS